VDAASTRYYLEDVVQWKQHPRVGECETKKNGMITDISYQQRVLAIYRVFLYTNFYHRYNTQRWIDFHEQ